MQQEISFIAGPDGIRDASQVREVVSWGSNNGVIDLRGGIVKPRSAPHNHDGTPSWTGLGFEAGLPVLLEGLINHTGSFTVEVWNPSHVHTIDNVTKSSSVIFHKQIGARTGPGNVIKEIADAMANDPKQSRLVVKNQMEPDTKTFINRILWANESISLSRIMGVGRGHPPGNMMTRNNDNLDELLALRKRFPDLDIVVDISHTAGISPENVLRFADRVVAFHNQVLGEFGIVLLNKIMFEVDPNRRLALCDQDQLLDLLTAERLVNKIRKSIQMGHVYAENWLN